MKKETNYYNELLEAQPEAVVGAFKKLCQKLFLQVEKGELSIEKAAYVIAGTMFFDVVEKNETLEDIAMTAGELELPPHQLSKPQDVLYQELKELVEQL